MVTFEIAQHDHLLYMQLVVRHAFKSSCGVTHVLLSFVRLPWFRARYMYIKRFLEFTAISTPLSYPPSPRITMFFRAVVVLSVLSAAFGSVLPRALPTPVSAATARTYLAARTL